MNLYRRQIRERTAHRIRWNKCAASGVLYLQALVRGDNSGQFDAHRQQFQTTGF
jgi:hypothetical protein